MLLVINQARLNLPINKVAGMLRMHGLVTSLNQKVLALQYSPAIPLLSPLVGEAWIQMTGA